MAINPPQLAAPQPSPIKSTLGAIALAFGVVAFGAVLFDWHAHSCCRCGHRWRHLGAFNLGDEAAHSCEKCGATQWVKDGWQRALGQDTSSEGLLPTPGAVLPALPTQHAPRPYVPPPALATLRRPAVQRPALPSLAGLLEEQKERR